MPDFYVVPIPAGVLERALAALNDTNSTTARDQSLVDFVDILGAGRPVAQLLNQAADLIVEFHEPYSDHEAWRDAMNMLVNVAAHLTTLPPGHPPLHELDQAARLAVLRDAIAAGWSGLENAVAYRFYFTDVVFAGVSDDAGEEEAA